MLSKKLEISSDALKLFEHNPEEFMSNNDATWSVTIATLNKFESSNIVQFQLTFGKPRVR